jgi:hypothetical protein
MEETSLIVSDPHLVFIEEAGEPYGTQYVYVCKYASGTVAMPATSDEAKINALGKNIYTPMWLPVVELPDIPFLSETLKNALIDGLIKGFPEQPINLKKQGV